MGHLPRLPVVVRSLAPNSSHRVIQRSRCEHAVLRSDPASVFQSCFTQRGAQRIRRAVTWYIYQLSEEEPALLQHLAPPQSRSSHPLGRNCFCHRHRHKHQLPTPTPTHTCITAKLLVLPTTTPRHSSQHTPTAAIATSYICYSSETHARHSTSGSASALIATTHELIVLAPLPLLISRFSLRTARPHRTKRHSSRRFRQTKTWPLTDQRYRPSPVHNTPVRALPRRP